MKSLKERIANAIDTNLKLIHQAQDSNNQLVNDFFEKAFEDNGQSSIYYEGENEGSDNLIIDEGAIIEVREIYPDMETIHSGEKVYSIKVQGVCQEDCCPYENDLMNLDYQSIISIFGMFKNQF